VQTGLKGSCPATDEKGMLEARRTAPRSTPSLTATTGANDRGGIVLGWLTKLTVFLAVGGVMLFDVISVGSTKASLADQAGQAAHAASATWLASRNVQTAYLAAEREATDLNPANKVLVKSFSIAPDGTVRLTLRREASTLLLFRWSRTAKWADVRATGEGLDVT
jgi:hypothetical protein